MPQDEAVTSWLNELLIEHGNDKDVSPDALMALVKKR
jgi:hypothetical protein